MRLNPNIYKLAEGYEPIEVQEFDGRIVEVYHMDDFPSIYDQNTSRGKFVVWASANGKDYRLFIEKGFHEAVSELYTEPINKIWLDFWDKCDDTTKKFNFKILLPIALVCIAAFFIVSFIPGTESWSTYAELAILVVFVIGMLFLNKFTKKKLNDLNKESVDLIKGVLTVDGFNDVLERQKNYIDSFFDRKQAEIDAELAREEAADKGEDKYVDEEENVTGVIAATSTVVNTDDTTSTEEEKVEDTTVVEGETEVPSESETSEEADTATTVETPDEVETEDTKTTEETDTEVVDETSLVETEVTDEVKLDEIEDRKEDVASTTEVNLNDETKDE